MAFAGFIATLIVGNDLMKIFVYEGLFYESFCEIGKISYVGEEQCPCDIYRFERGLCLTHSDPCYEAEMTHAYRGSSKEGIPGHLFYSFDSMIEQQFDANQRRTFISQVMKV